MKMKKVKLSNHGRKRVKERHGSEENKVAKRAYNYGIKREYTIGELRQYLDAVYYRHLEEDHTPLLSANHKPQRILRIYGNSVFIFHNNLLITSIVLPDKFTKDLSSYVKKEEMDRYLSYKYQRNHYKPIVPKEYLSNQLKEKLSENTS